MTSGHAQGSDTRGPGKGCHTDLNTKEPRGGGGVEGGTTRNVDRALKKDASEMMLSKVVWCSVHADKDCLES